MATNAQEALGHLDDAKNHADKGEFEDAWDDWTDACEAMENARTGKEPKGSGTEREQAEQAAQRLLENYGKEMARARVEGLTTEKELERLWKIIAEIKAAAD